jgi:hypothetical protein
MRVFGCAAYVHIPDRYRDKLDALFALHMYIGLPEHKKGYRLLDLKAHTIVDSRDVRFDEHTVQHLSDMPKIVPTPAFPLTVTSPATTTNVPTLLAFKEALKRTRVSLIAKDTDVTNTQLQSKMHFAFGVGLIPSNTTSHPSSANIFASTEDIREHEGRSESVNTLVAARHIDELSTFKQAMKSAHTNDWQAAAESEYQPPMGYYQQDLDADVPTEWLEDPQESMGFRCEVQRRRFH